MALLRWTMVVAGTAITVGFGLILGVVCALMAPARGRRWDTGLAWGVWLGPFYLIYLLFQPRVDIAVPTR